MVVNPPEIYVSTSDDIMSIININIENIVCLSICIFIFSRLLSAIISLYNFIPLTDNASIAGMYIMLWNSIVDTINIIPLPVPSVAIIEDIVYPML